MESSRKYKERRSLEPNNEVPDFLSKPDEVVWVKLSNVWWPGQIVDRNNWPEECLTMKKTPLAVVRFFQEDGIFEYVKTRNNIYSYNCSRKNEFIRKGLELHRAKQEYMKTFPGDVQTAEELTGGDPKIIESNEILEKPKKSNDWADIFKGPSSKNKRTSIKLSPSPQESRESTPKPTRSYETQSSMSLTPVTPLKIADSQSHKYKCHMCNFSTDRIYLIMNHSKSHSSASILTPGSTSNTPQQVEETSNTTIIEQKPTSLKRPREDESPEKESESEPEPEVKTRSRRKPTPRAKPPPRKRSRKVEKKDDTPVTTKTRESPAKTHKKQELRKEILADWLDEDSDDETHKTEQEKDQSFEELSLKNVPETAIDAIAVEASTSQQTLSPKIQTPVTKIRNIPKKQRYLEYKTDMDPISPESKPEKEEKPEEFSKVTNFRDRKVNSRSIITEDNVKPSMDVDSDKLNAEIENIMNETKVPEIPLQMDSSKSHKENDLEKRNLPPKERNKRIFNSKTRKSAGTEEFTKEQETIAVSAFPTQSTTTCHIQSETDPIIKTKPEVTTTDPLLQIPKKKHLRSLKVAASDNVDTLSISIQKETPDTRIVDHVSTVVLEPSQKHETRLPKKRKTPIDEDVTIVSEQPPTTSNTPSPSNINNSVGVGEHVSSVVVRERSRRRMYVDRSKLIRTAEKPKQKIKAPGTQPIYITSQGFLTTTADSSMTADNSDEPRIIITESMIIVPANNCSQAQNEDHFELAETSTTTSTATRTTPKKEDTSNDVVAESSPVVALELPEKILQTPKKQEEEITQKIADKSEPSDEISETIEVIIENQNTEICADEIICEDPVGDDEVTDEAGKSNIIIEVSVDENAKIEVVNEAEIIEECNSDKMPEESELTTNEVDENNEIEVMEVGEEEAEGKEAELEVPETEVMDQEESAETNEAKPEETEEVVSEEPEKDENEIDEVKSNEIPEIEPGKLQTDEGDSLDKKPEEFKDDEKIKDAEKMHDETSSAQNTPNVNLNTADFLEESDKGESDFEESDKIQSLLENMDSQDSTQEENLVPTKEITETVAEEPETSKETTIIEDTKEIAEKSTPPEIHTDSSEKDESNSKVQKKSGKKKVLANVTPEKLELMTKKGMIKEVHGKKQLTEKAHRKMKEQMRSKKLKLQEMLDQEQQSNSSTTSTTDKVEVTRVPETSVDDDMNDNGNDKNNCLESSSPVELEVTDNEQQETKNVEQKTDEPAEKMEIDEEKLDKESEGINNEKEQHKESDESTNSSTKNNLSSSNEKVMEVEETEVVSELHEEVAEVEEESEAVAEEECTKEEEEVVSEMIEENVEVTEGDEKDDANTSGTSEDQIFAVGAETFGGPANCFYLCINKNGAITPIDYQPLYLDSTNQLVPRTEPVEVEPETVENNNVSVVINTANGQLMLDEQTLYRLAAESGEVIGDGQQIVLSPDLLASLLNSQEIDPGTTEIIVANNSNISDVETQLVDTFPPGGLPPVTAHVSETSATHTPRMATTIAPKIATPPTSLAQSASVTMSGTIDDSLAAIGVTTQTRHVVPTSLELPITVTNPIIADSVNHRKLMENSIILPDVDSVIIEENATVNNESTN